MTNILVAGGTDGLGLEIVKLLDKNEENTISVIGRNASKLNELPDIRFIELDITNEAKVEEFASSFIANLDILIISIGIFGHGKLVDFSYEQIRRSIETNFLGHIFLTRALLSKINEGGRIISINSISGVNVTKERSLLCGAKWGLRGFYNSLSEDLKEKKIMITQIFPGYFDSDYMDKVGIPKDKSKAIKKELLAQQIVSAAQLPSGIYLPEIQIKNIEYA